MDENYIYGPYCKNEQEPIKPTDDLIRQVLQDEDYCNMIKANGNHLQQCIAFCTSAFTCASGNAKIVDEALRRSPLYTSEWDDRAINGHTMCDYVLHRAFIAYQSHKLGFQISVDRDSPLPRFPSGVFPAYIAEYVEAVAANAQVPVELVAPMALAMLSICALGRYVVGERNGHIQHLPLYIMCVAAPGARKSSVLHKMIGLPISLAREKTGHTETITDTTPEALGKCMFENNGRAYVVSDEDGTVRTLFGNTYSKSTNYDIVLKAYDAEPLEVKRITRDYLHIAKPELTIMLALQPLFSKSFITNPFYRGAGLIARFLFSTSESNLGHRTYSAPMIPPAVEKAYVGRTVSLLTGRTHDEPMVIVESDDAYRAIEKYFDEKEAQALDNPHYDVDGSARHISTTLRIAALLHIANDPFSHEISGEEMCHAIAIARYFAANAKWLFDDSAAWQDEQDEDVSSIIRVLRDNGMPVCTRSEFQKHCRRHYSGVDELIWALNKAEAAGVIKTTLKPSEKGGPPSQIITANPQIFL